MHRDELATFIDFEWRAVRRIIRMQWWMAVAVILFAFVSIVVVLSFTFAKLERQPRALVLELIASQKVLQESIANLRTAQATPAGDTGANLKGTSAMELDKATGKLLKAQEESLNRFADIEAKPTNSSQSMVQLVGSAAVLALLGLLGLQRLQNFDTEINSLRASVDTRVESRAKEVRDLVQEMRKEVNEFRAQTENQLSDKVGKVWADFEKSIQTAVRGQFAETSKELPTLIDNARAQSEKLLSDIKCQIDEQSEKLHAEREQTEAVARRIDELLKEYPWLQERGATEVLEKIQNLASVEEAHEVASVLARQNDRASARAALRQVVERKLLGGYDDFHNAHSEAMRLKDPVLGLGIAERGLEAYPNQADLVADKMFALTTLGRTDEARRFVEDWKKDYPDAYRVAWRANMFYANIWRGTPGSENDTAEIEEVLRAATESMPNRVKVWATRAQFAADRERHLEAAQIVEEGLRHNPFSQQLNFMRGEYLLVLGKPEEAREALEKAFGCDVQEQFQHDVAQAAVPGLLAQACEACGETEKAIRLYTYVCRSGDLSSHHVVSYAQSRLRALAALGSESAQAALRDTAGGLDGGQAAIRALWEAMQQSSEGKDGDD